MSKNLDKLLEELEGVKRKEYSRARYRTDARNNLGYGGSAKYRGAQALDSFINYLAKEQPSTPEDVIEARHNRMEKQLFTQFNITTQDGRDKLTSKAYQYKEAGKFEGTSGEDTFIRIMDRVNTYTATNELGNEYARDLNILNTPNGLAIKLNELMGVDAEEGETEAEAKMRAWENLYANIYDKISFLRDNQMISNSDASNWAQIEGKLNLAYQEITEGLTSSTGQPLGDSLTEEDIQSIVTGKYAKDVEAKRLADIEMKKIDYMNSVELDPNSPTYLRQQYDALTSALNSYDQQIIKVGSAYDAWLLANEPTAAMLDDAELLNNHRKLQQEQFSSLLTALNRYGTDYQKLYNKLLAVEDQAKAKNYAWYTGVSFSELSGGDDIMMDYGIFKDDKQLKQEELYNQYKKQHKSKMFSTADTGTTFTVGMHDVIPFVDIEMTKYAVDSDIPSIVELFVDPSEQNPKTADWAVEQQTLLEEKYGADYDFSINPTLVKDKIYRTGDFNYEGETDDFIILSKNINYPDITGAPKGIIPVQTPTQTRQTKLYYKVPKTKSNISTFGSSVDYKDGNKTYKFQYDPFQEQFTTGLIK